MLAKAKAKSSGGVERRRRRDALGTCSYIVLLPRYLCLQDSCHWRWDCRQLCGQRDRLQRCQRVPWYRHRLDHGRHLLGVPGRGLHCPRRKVAFLSSYLSNLTRASQPGLLRDHLLSGSSVCHPHPFGKTTSCSGWRARWTQDLQNNFIFPLRLLLVFLRHDLRSGDVRRHWTWLLSSHTNLRKQYMSLRTRHSPCDRCEVDPKSSPTSGWRSVLDIEPWNKTQFALSTSAN